MGRTVFAALVLALCAGVAHAQLNKCTGADGKISYSDKPCPTGAKGTVMIKAPEKPAPAAPAAQSQQQSQPPSQAPGQPTTADPAATGYDPVAPGDLIPRAAPRKLPWSAELTAMRCMDGWNQTASPSGRAFILKVVRERFDRGGPAVKDKLRLQGMTVDEAIAITIEQETAQFEFDCKEFGFRPVGPANDAYNERVSRDLKASIDARTAKQRKK